MQERGRVMVMSTQVAEPSAKTERPLGTDKPKQVEARTEKADGQLETVYVGLLLGAALTLLGLVRKRIPV
jgi:hypothetical protein